MSNNRIYSKKEISHILSKASEIQTKKDLYGDEEGLNEEELLHIAQEVGIDKETLFEAIRNSDYENLDFKFSWLKATTKIQDITTIDGEITGEEWEEIVQEIRLVTGGIGKSNKTDKSFEWEQRSNEIGYKHFSFTPQNGHTKLQMVSSWTPLKLLANILGFMFGFLALLILFKEIDSKQMGLLMGPLGGLGGIAIGRIFLKSYYEKQKKQIIDIKSAVSKKFRSFGNKSIEIEDTDVYESGRASDTKNSKLKN